MLNVQESSKICIAITFDYLLNHKFAYNNVVNHKNLPNSQFYCHPVPIN